MHNLMYKIFQPSSTKTRYFSTVEDPLLLQLSRIIDDLLYEYEESNIDQTPNRELLLSGKYVLSKPSVYLLGKRDIGKFYDVYSDEYNPFIPSPGLMGATYPKIAILPTKEDTFLLMGLARLLLRLSGRPQRVGKQINEFSFMEQECYNNLIKEPVDRLYKLDLKSSEGIILNKTILDRVAPLVGEGSAVYNLISSFLNLDMVDIDIFLIDKYRNFCRVGICMLSKLLLPFGDINRVLFHIVLMDLDREFQKRYPSVRYYRLLDEIYVLTNSNNSSEIFDKQAGYALLGELGLIGGIKSIRPGDAPLRCRRRWCDNDDTHSVHLDCDRYVRVLSKKDGVIAGR